MENASKALLIAGGVLIAMIITSFGVYLYGVYRGHSENMIAKMTEKEVTEFNAKFTVFEDRELTANEVVSIMNLVRNNNRTMTGDEYKIEIKFNHRGVSTGNVSKITNFLNLQNLMSKNDDDFFSGCNDFIQDFSKKDDKFCFLCDIEKINNDNSISSGYSSETGLVKDVTVRIKEK